MTRWLGTAISFAMGSEVDRAEDMPDAPHLHSRHGHHLCLLKEKFNEDTRREQTQDRS